MKLLWHSNAPWAPTGYGQQTALFCPILAERYDLAISAFYGLQGAPIKWDGIPVLPGIGDDFELTLPEHAQRFFGGDSRGGLIVTLMDVWVLNPAKAADFNVACWTPIDHEPAPQKIVDFFLQANAVPIAMSRFGERLLGRLDPEYVPHGVDCEIYKPGDREAARAGAFPPGAFVVGMVAANKGRPSRKAFAQSLEAFARLLAEHENVYLYLHSELNPMLGAGENIAGLMRMLDIPVDHVKAADAYAINYRPYGPEQMAQIYQAFDVLLNPSLGEGFGIPIVEAQACGIPVIVTDATAMKEVCGAGWRVSHHPYWTGLNSWQFVPDIDDIHAALEDCYQATAIQRAKLSQQARAHALQYDVRRVTTEFMLPAMRRIEQRFEARRPVTIPSRLTKVAA
jgi:glycosyltransferase involved in cell wall biosynthesis